MTTKIQIVEKPQHRLYCLLSDKERILEIQQNIETLTKKTLKRSQSRHKTQWLTELKVSLWCIQNPHKLSNFRPCGIETQEMSHEYQ